MQIVNSPWRRLLRRFDAVQNVYESRKNAGRSRVISGFIPKGGIGAELGVHKGHFTRTLLKRLEPELLYAVDPWYLLGPTWDWAAGDRSTVNGLRTVLRRISCSLVVGRAQLVVADDIAWLATLDDASLDWVYLDSSHAYEHTIAELELLVGKVRPGGIIAGDDWQPSPSHRHHGVARALREFAEDGRIELALTEQRWHQWVARVKPVADRAVTNR